MIYDLIFTELIDLFNAISGTWQYTGVEVFSFILTTIFILLFMAIPLYAFKSLLASLNGSEVDYIDHNRFRRSKRVKNRK